MSKIRLTESQLHNVIKESIHRILKEDNEYMDIEPNGKQRYEANEETDVFSIEQLRQLCYQKFIVLPMFS